VRPKLKTKPSSASSQGVPTSLRGFTLTSLSQDRRTPMNTLPFAIPDLRETCQPIASLPIKLPLFALDALQTQADQLRCNRTTLARTLLIRGLKQLEQGIE
jgi:hypothetical protein